MALDDSIITEIDRRILAGETVTEIVNAVGCARGTVSKRRLELGYTKRRDVVRSDVLLEARRLYEEEGRTFHAIMKRTGIAWATLESRALDEGWERQVPKVKQGAFIPPDNFREIWDGLQKKTIDEFAKAMGCKWGVARKLAEKHDLPGRGTNESSLLPFADLIRQWYVGEGLIDALIVKRLRDEKGLTLRSADTVRQFRINVLGIQSNRQRKVGRFSVSYRLSQVSDEQLSREFDETEQTFLIGRHGAQRRTKSVDRLAKQYGCSASVMHKELKDRGILADRFSFAQDAARIYSMFQAGHSVPKTAAELGCTQDFVRSVLHKLGEDLSGHTSRMSAEEHRQWRIAIRQGRARSEKEGGRYVHRRTGVRMDSTWEIRFADYCDQYGLDWERFKRTEETLLPVNLGGDLDTMYGPDFWVTYNGERVLVEVKGIYGADDYLKIHAWRAERGDLSLLTHDELSDFFVAKTAQEAFDVVRAGYSCDPSAKKILRNRGEVK